MLLAIVIIIVTFFHTGHLSQYRSGAVWVLAVHAAIYHEHTNIWGGRGEAVGKRGLGLHRIPKCPALLSVRINTTLHFTVFIHSPACVVVVTASSIACCILILLFIGAWSQVVMFHHVVSCELRRSIQGWLVGSFQHLPTWLCDSDTRARLMVHIQVSTYIKLQQGLSTMSCKPTNWHNNISHNTYHSRMCNSTTQLQLCWCRFQLVARWHAK